MTDEEQPKMNMEVVVSDTGEQSPMSIGFNENRSDHNADREAADMMTSREEGKSMY